MTQTPTGAAAPTDSAPAPERVDPPLVADEMTSLVSWLDYHRATLLWKCQGLTDEQLRRRSVPPSGLSLLGLVRHMVEVERWWFRINAAGEDVRYEYCTDESPDGDFDEVDSADPAADLETFRREVEACRRAVEGLSADHTFTNRRGKPLSMRWVYVHMIEEYARHNGHADLLRETIDGATGD